MAKPKRSIKLRHIEKERLAEAKQKRLTKAKLEQVKAARELRRRVIGAEEFEDGELDDMEIPGAEEFQSGRYTHISEFMYPLNDFLDETSCYDLLQMHPTEVERTIRETPNEASVELTALTNSPLGLGHFMGAYDASTSEQQHLRAQTFFVHYEGTMYRVTEVNTTDEESFETMSMQTGQERRVVTAYPSLSIRAVAVPDRHISKRNG